jgi:Ser/Thr protein kinase RdoA (MazF antagonist)
VHHEAVDWAESVLGEPVVAVERLSGGLTSTMLSLTDRSGRQAVLRLMTNEPWRMHGAPLTRRERDAQAALAGSAVPAPMTLGLDADGTRTRVAAHLMTRLPGRPAVDVSEGGLAAMAELLAVIHDVRPAEPFRPYQSWAWEAKRVVPGWTRDHAAWLRAFDILEEEPPAFEPTFIHRDFSHRNLLWVDDRISGVVDWVETSTGPVWLDAAHAATNLALAYGQGHAVTFLDAYGAVTGQKPDQYWLVMDAVGFLPPPGRTPLFGSPTELQRLDHWLQWVVA